MGAQNGTDIIIPVYNAFDDLQLCVESIKKYTDLKINRLILVNDKSPDERILPYLREQQNEAVVVLNNEENLGFSGSVNRGMSFSGRDVILLNSDTVVTRNWVEKIAACAYSDPGIATVTPFSNAATICSLPVFCRDNRIPENIGIDEMADLVEKCSLRKYPRLTVAVGFCMFIKREVIDCVGLFDQKTFCRGYGEENDFCWRAEQMGYRSVLCDDTFIYHKGSASFVGKEKLQLMREHEKILEERYPRQVRENQVFCSRDENHLLRDNVNLYLPLRNGRKNILYVLHYDFCESAINNIGGTQFHVKDLTMGLKDRYNIFVLSRDLEYLRLTIYRGEDVVTLKFPVGPERLFPVTFDSRIREVCRNILTAFSIDLVHIHHTLSLSLDIFYEAKEQNIPIIATLHDFYYVCPALKMLNAKNELCIGRETPEMCRECLRSALGITAPADFVARWRRQNLEALLLCRQIIMPSESAKRLIGGYFPQLIDKIKVIPHGSDPFAEEKPILGKVHITQRHKCYFESFPATSDESDSLSGWAYIEGQDSIKSKIYVDVSDASGFSLQIPCKKIHRADVAGENRMYVYSGFQATISYQLFQAGRLRVRTLIENDGIVTTDGRVLLIDNREKRGSPAFHVAFIGGLNPPKGSITAYEMIRHSPESIRWYLFGGIGDKDLRFFERKNLVKTGWYRREDLPKLIRQFQISLICILPICPETFCYTLSEALLAGVPVVLRDIGAIGERADSLDDCTWKVPVDAGYEEILQLILHISGDREEYQEKAKAAAHVKLRSVAEMLRDYDALYGGYTKRVPSYAPRDPQQILTALSFAGSENGFSGMASPELMIRLNAAEQQLKEINSSLGYKALKEFRKLKIPFKRQIKALMYRCYKLLRRKKALE